MPRLVRILNSPLRRIEFWVYREKELNSSRNPLTCCRSKYFIPVGGELAHTPSLTLVVPRDMAETYGGRVVATACGGGMGRHATLMGMGQAASCSGTSTSDSRSDKNLVPRADMASSEVLPWPSIWHEFG
ncbi:hypothetical protein BHE74_00034802 [Ensete ventricosum]|nr:hypothetical protein BHE74_00034802 [Ensete ventricosum]